MLKGTQTTDRGSVERMNVFQAVIENCVEIDRVLTVLGGTGDNMKSKFYTCQFNFTDELKELFVECLRIREELINLGREPEASDIETFDTFMGRFSRVTCTDYLRGQRGIFASLDGDAEALAVQVKEHRARYQKQIEAHNRFTSRYVRYWRESNGRDEEGSSMSPSEVARFTLSVADLDQLSVTIPLCNSDVEDASERFRLLAFGNGGTFGSDGPMALFERPDRNYSEVRFISAQVASLAVERVRSANDEINEHSPVWIGKFCSKPGDVLQADSTFVEICVGAA